MSNVTEHDLAEIRAVLADVRGAVGVDPETPRVERLGGLSNRNFKLVAGDIALALRLPGPASRTIVDRNAEVAAARLAHELGFGPSVVFADPQSGIMITRFVGDGLTLAAANLASDQRELVRVAETMARLHGCGRTVPRRIDLFAAIDHYESLLASTGGPGAPWSDRLRSTIDRIRAELAASPPTLCFCHGDPVPDNFVSDADRLLLIDWEYAGMGDAAWDLAYLATEAGLDTDAVELLRTAHGGTVARDDLARHLLLAPALGNLWGAVQYQTTGRRDLQDWTRSRIELAEQRAASRLP